MEINPSVRRIDRDPSGREHELVFTSHYNPMQSYARVVRLDLAELRRTYVAIGDYLIRENELTTLEG